MYAARRLLMQRVVPSRWPGLESNRHYVEVVLDLLSGVSGAIPRAEGDRHHAQSPASLSIAV